MVYSQEQIFTVEVIVEVFWGYFGVAKLEYTPNSKNLKKLYFLIIRINSRYFYIFL
jgi:hypothetical protein